MIKPTSLVAAVLLFNGVNAIGFQRAPANLIGMTFDVDATDDVLTPIAAPRVT